MDFDKKTYLTHLERTRQNWRYLPSVPIEYQTNELCLFAVNENGLSLKHVENQSIEMCFAAVSENGVALHYAKYKTKEICLKAISKDLSAIHFVDDLTEIAPYIPDETISRGVTLPISETANVYVQIKELKQRMLIAESGIDLIDNEPSTRKPRTSSRNSL